MAGKIAELGALVKDKIRNSTDTVLEKTVSALAEVEIANRVSLLQKSLETLKTLEKELSKTGADLKTYNEDGSVISESYSQKRLQERQKVQAKIKKLNTTVDDAIATGDFSKLKNLNLDSAPAAETPEA